MITDRFVRLGLFALVLLLPFFVSDDLRGQTTPAAGAAKPPVYIILKLDDVTVDSPGWKRTFEYLKEKKVKHSMGIICSSLERTDRPSYFAWLKMVQESGLVEFWSHGYDHKEWTENNVKLQEFKGPSYEQQKEHFTKAQNLAKEKLGITLHTFGAPFNATDETTLKVMSEDPDVKVFLYGNPKDAATIPNIMILDRTQMNIENPLFVPNSQRVEHDYNILTGPGKRDCFVLQGHANQWDDARFEEFKKLVEVLISKEVIFTTPYEYYLLKTNGGTAPLPVAVAPAPAAAAAPATPAKPAAPSTPTALGEVLANGGFEQDEAGWSIYVPKDATEKGCAFAVTTEDPHGGQKVGKLSATTPARYCALQYPNGLTYAVGDRYRLTAWVKAGPDFKPEAGTPGFALRVSMFADQGSSMNAENGLFYVGLKNTAVRGDVTPLKGQEIPDKWTKLEAVFEIAPETAKLNVCVFVWSASGTFYMDDVSLEKVAGTTEITPLAVAAPK